MACELTTFETCVYYIKGISRAEHFSVLPREQRALMFFTHNSESDFSIPFLCTESVLSTLLGLCRPASGQWTRCGYVATIISRVNLTTL